MPLSSKLSAKKSSTVLAPAVPPYKSVPFSEMTMSKTVSSLGSDPTPPVLVPLTEIKRAIDPPLLTCTFLLSVSPGSILPTTNIGNPSATPSQTTSSSPKAWEELLTKIGIAKLTTRPKTKLKTTIFNVLICFFIVSFQLATPGEGEVSRAKSETANVSPSAESTPFGLRSEEHT